jgi:beta-phosphoglucomutase-like phosphatase (HAD superfamily)
MTIGIIFDCDGTLIDSEHAYFLSWQVALKARGSSMTFEEYMTLAGHSGAHISKKLHEKTPFDSAEAILADAKKAYRELHSHLVTPIERTLKFVRQLARQKQSLGIKMGVASAAAKKELLLNLNRFELTGLFDMIISGRDDLDEYSDPEGTNKPKPYIYLHTAKQLGLHPSRCVALEDSGPGVQAAVSAGCLTFALPNSVTERHDFSRAHFTIDSSSEIDLEEFFQKIYNHINPSHA